jgi:methyl-accepting chemotaxis protein
MSPGQLVPDALRDSYLKKFAAIVLLVMLVTAGAGVFFQGQVGAELRHDKHAELQTVAETEATETAQWVEERRLATRMLSEFEVVHSGDPERITAFLNAEIERLPGDVHEVNYVDTETAAVLASSDDAMVGTNLREAGVSWAQEDLEFDDEHDVRVMTPFEDDGTWTMAFLSPVPGAPDRAIMLTADATAVAELYSHPVEGSYTEVVAADGTTVFAREESKIDRQYRFGGDAPMVRTARNGETGAMDMDGAGVVAGYAPVEGTDWALVVHAPQSAAYALVDAVTRDFVVLVGIGLLGFVAIGLTLGRNTVRALRRISERAEAIAAGDLNAEVERSTRVDEIGDLVNAFGEMQGNLATAGEQAEAVADQRFDDPVLDERVPGDFGDSIRRMADAVEANQRELEELNAGLERKADSYSRVMEATAAGDLTRRMDPDAENDSMARIGRTFNRMVDELEGTVTEIRAFAADVAASSEEASVSADEVETAGGQVSESIQEISAGAARQSERLQGTADEMSDLSATIEEVAASATQVAGVVDRAADLGADGGEFAADALEEMDRIDRTAEETIDAVASLDEEMDRIEEIASLINGIAEQTNLLALNASIEAASAGEAGDGFAVVADEIKELAGETEDATEDIESLIADVQEQTGETVADMREMGERVSDGRETVEQALDALDGIADQVEEANAGVREIDDATDEQAESVEAVVADVEEVAALSEQSTAEAQNVSAAAEEQTASLSEVSDTVQQLSGRAEDLRETLAAFEVSDGTRSSDPADGTPARATPATDGGASDDPRR